MKTWWQNWRGLSLFNPWELSLPCITCFCRSSAWQRHLLTAAVLLTWLENGFPVPGDYQQLSHSSLLSVVSIAPFLVLFCGATVDTLKMVSRLCQAPLTVDRRWVRSLALDGVRSTDSQCLTVHQRILSYQLSSSINIVENKKEILGHSFCCLSTELQQMPNAISLIVSTCV